MAGLSGSNSVVESQPSKLLVAGSIPVSRSRNFLPSRTENEKEWEELKDAINRARVEEFLKRVRKTRVRVRDPEGLWSGVFEKVDETVGKLGEQNLFHALTVSDQTQRREFYLSKVEEVESGLRIKLQQLYRYY